MSTKHLICESCENDEYVNYLSFPTVTNYPWIKDFLEDEKRLVHFCCKDCRDKFFICRDLGLDDDDFLEFSEEDDWMDSNFYGGYTKCQYPKKI